MAFVMLCTHAGLVNMTDSSNLFTKYFLKFKGKEMSKLACDVLTTMLIKSMLRFHLQWFHSF